MNIPIIRQDMLPAKTSVAGIKKDNTVVTPASKIVCHNADTVQWPPKQPTMANRRQFQTQAPAAKVVIIRQDMLPARTSVAGIQKVSNMMAMLPAKKHVCEDFTMQWPPTRPGMNLRHVIASSSDDRRISWVVEDNSEQGLPPTPRANKLRKKVSTLRTQPKTKSMPILLCKTWKKRASLHTAPIA